MPPKLLFARLLIAVLLLLWLARIAVTRTVVIKRTPLDVALLLFLGSAALSSVFAENRNVAWLGTYTRYDGLLTLLTYAALFWLAVQSLALRGSATKAWPGKSHLPRNRPQAKRGTPTSQVPAGASNTIEKLDLSTGTITPFFSQSSGISQVTGLDLQGDPIIQVSYPQGQAIFIVSPQNYYPIAAMTYGGYYGSFPSGTPIADRHCIWSSTRSGVILYTGGRWYLVAQIGRPAGRPVPLASAY